MMYYKIEPAAVRNEVLLLKVNGKRILSEFPAHRGGR